VPHRPLATHARAHGGAGCVRRLGMLNSCSQSALGACGVWWVKCKAWPFAVCARVRDGLCATPGTERHSQSPCTGGVVLPNGSPCKTAASDPFKVRVRAQLMLLPCYDWGDRVGRRHVSVIIETCRWVAHALLVQLAHRQLTTHAHMDGGDGCALPARSLNAITMSPMSVCGVWCAKRIPRPVCSVCCGQCVCATGCAPHRAPNDTHSPHALGGWWHRTVALVKPRRLTHSKCACVHN
jgi:hypothetical protein